MKPGWVLNEDERARRFRKLRMKKTEQPRTKHPREFQCNLIQHPGRTENNHGLRRKLSPSPTAYYKRRQQNILIDDNADRKRDNGTNHPYKRMCLQLGDGREVLHEAMEKQHSSNCADAMELEKYRHGQMRPQVEQNTTKHEYDQVVSSTELLYAAKGEIIKERRTFPRLDEAHPSRSRSQCRDDTVEELVAFLRNIPAELAAISNDPTGRMYLGQERSRLTSSAKANRLVDNNDKDLLCKFSTFRPISSAAMTNVRHGSRPMYSTSSPEQV